MEPYNEDVVETDLVTILINDGEAQESFPVRKDLLTACSPYFKAAFDGKFREATDNKMPIPDVTSLQFKLFLDWLYLRHLPEGKKSGFGSKSCLNCSDAGTACESRRQMAGFRGAYKKHGTPGTFQGFPTISTEVDHQLECLIDTGPWDLEKLYVFADRCDVPNLRQQLISKIWVAGLRLNGAVIYAMRHLPISSPLCSLFLDTYAKEFDLTAAQGDEECGTEILLRQKLPAEFVWGVLLKKLSEKHRDGKPVCTYHEHRQDDETIKRCRN